MKQAQSVLKLYVKKQYIISNWLFGKLIFDNPKAAKTNRLINNQS